MVFGAKAESVKKHLSYKRGFLIQFLKDLQSCKWRFLRKKLFKDYLNYNPGYFGVKFLRTIETIILDILKTIFGGISELCVWIGDKIFQRLLGL